MTDTENVFDGFALAIVYNGATSAFTITRNRFVESGYYYKVTFVVDVYDSNGTYIETLRATSDVLYV